MGKNETNNGKKGGLLKGKPHYDKNGKPLGGIKAIVTDTNTPVELEGGEVIINKEASKKYWRELSKINQSAGNGVPIKNPNGSFDEDPEEYKDGGNVIQFNPNHTPSKIIINYAKKIKSEYPKVWDKGGNIFGNEAFKNLNRVSERGYWLDSEKWMYIKWRSYVARHKQDFRINGVVAMLKWADKVNKGWGYMKDLIEAKIDKKYPTKMAKGGEVVTYKNKFNKKYGFDKNEGHSLEEISKIAKIKLSSLQDIYDKGIGAYKTNPESVRPNVKSKEQWAMARVYSAIRGGKASKVDANELSEGKMEHGGTFYTRTYNDGTIQKFSVEDYEKNVYPNLEKGGALYLAPNGNESNLTPEQYKLVRTPEFKAWFGDWENDPENASKVVDNNGEPLVAYHGSNNPNINIFDADKSGSVQYSDWGKGIYFTPYKSTANYYSNEALKKIDNEYNRLYEVFEKSQKSEDLKAFQKRGREMSDNENTITYSVFLNIKNPRTEYVDSMSYTDPFLSENAKMENKDGVFIKTSRGRFDEILAFYPNQIKLSDGTNTIFDSNNPDIRYSKGGELAKGIKAEKEHLETAKKLYQNKITPEQSAVEIAKDHLKENEHYYTELAKLEKKFAKGGNISDSYSSYEYSKNIKPIFWQMTLKQFCDYAKSNNLDTRLEGTNAKLQCEDFYKYVIIKPLLSNNAERNVFLLAIESNRMPYEAVEEIIKSVNLWDENNRKIIKIIDYINSYNVTSEIWRIPMELYLQKEYFQKNFTKANAIKWYEKHIYQYTYLDDKALKDMIEKGMVKYTDVIERLREAVGLANLSEQDKKQLMKLNETQSINILKGKLNGLLDIIESEKVDTSQFKQVNSIEQSNSKNAEVGKDMDKPQNWSKERLDKEIERLDPNESQGYGVSRNRVLKESMFELPDKARLSFELREFFLRIYGNDFKKEFDKTPLASLSQFFYSDFNSLKEWVDEQIKGIEENIESNKKYIDSLSNSKSSQKSREIWLDTIEKSKKIIEKLKSEYEKYEQEKNGFLDNSIKLDLIKNPLTELEIGFIESIKPEIEKGVSMNKTKIENIAKTFGILEQNRAKELTELSISILARSIAHNPSMNTEERFDRLVELYQSQPNLSHRTSESMMMQQYSTPAPIGYLMGIYCGIDKKGTKYFEPSAGNGLLVSAGYLDDGTLNELDEIRNKDLQYLGFKNVTQKDGTIPFTEYQKHFDAMLTNPPFGSIESVYYGKYEITSKEQLMSLRGLDTMKDDGKAAIIIGGHMEYDSQGRLKAGKNRTFFVYLYENYNIEDVININARMLYSKQGTSFNTRLILINGRKKEPKGFFPLITESKPSIEKFSKTPVDTYDDLWTRIIQHI
jgi:hypothetical protein